ncbi:MAG: 4Fe-4S dicluster domain-containing protein [Deltaproteobacteria bacterium]|nr:4Fe-4S dicluster domain-containing protein [Deltaproteobacteria bacterium]MBW2383530.1 4Fe-4S dicluster domain-containing protein [Deltaproteobacteria bacterium]
MRRPMEPTREIYWNILGGVLVYGLAALAIGVLVWRAWRRISLWRLGCAEQRLDRLPERILGLVVEIFTHRRLMRDRFPGIAHLFIFYGFFVSFLATSLIAVQEWTGVHFLKGPFYLGFSLLSDCFGLLGITGLLMALYWRGVVRPARLHSVLDDWIALGLLLLIFVQGFLVEGMRIAVTELRQQPDLALWSPGGYVVAQMLSGLSDEGLRWLHRFTWWFHGATAFAFIAYFAYGKFNHVLYGAANIVLRSFAPTGKLVHPDIDELLEEDEEALDRLGIDRIERFSWKSLMDLDACINCGRCESVCPATISHSPLSPRKLIQDMKHHMTSVGPRLQAAAGSPGAVAGVELTDGILFGDGAEGEPVPAVLEAELWGCRTCGACMQECPMYIEHIPKIVDMRRHLVMTESKMSEDAQTFLKNMDDRMHPFAGTSRDREEWFEDLDVKVYGRGDQADTLFWVGCAGSMVDRNIEVSRAMVKILDRAGVDFALLGGEEVCTGDPARRVGGELTYQMCAKENIETFGRYGIKKIITTCPHCFNTLKNEYGDYGGDYEVVHHSELIGELLHEARLQPKKDLDSVTYHDPCYLGRHNGVYDAPRRVIEGVSKAGALVELEKNRSRSHCCGSGGGYAWMDDKPEKRINHERFEQMQGCGAKTAAVSCPFCMQMFADASSALDPDQRLEVKDIAELVAESIEG